MAEPFRIGIAGLGTVGAGVVKIIQTHADLLERRSGRRVEIVAVNARDKSKDRGVDVSGYVWVPHPTDLLDHEIDCVLEMIGGENGVALDLVKGALSKGIHVVTANKALLAHHGAELAKLASENNASLAYEAAVAGGIPIIKALREGFAGNHIHAVYGILNGTCNYILTEMRETGRDFADVLEDAQKLGYAEADPTFDVDGIDAGHKLCLLNSLAFGVKPDFDALGIQGIRAITSTDIAFAGELGYRIKLLGIARGYGDQVMQRVEPCMVPIHSTLGAVEGVNNAVLVEGDFVQDSLLVGRGAGEGPTASAVMGDVMDLARGSSAQVFSVPAETLADASWKDIGEMKSRYYLRLTVLDKPGVIADVSAILRDHDISIETMIQHGRDPDQPVCVVLTTHEACYADLSDACAAIAKLAHTSEDPCMIPILAL